MKKNWIIKETNDDLVEKLHQALHISPVLCKLLVSRGVTDYQEARSFFRPSLRELHDPFLMKDMDKAISRIEKAMVNDEKIMVYGDYDVDGTTSVALVYSFFREIYAKIYHYIPDRYEEGYGISYQGIDYAEENGISLIIALDCGIKAIEKIEYATEKGVDFIICDHHRPGDEIPAAVAVLDPKRSDCEYPFKELSGCSIGFKLIQAFGQSNDIPFELIANFLDLVAVSIAADIVPIVDENRILTFYGLKQLNLSPRFGFKALIETSGLENKEIGISDIVFILGPRINAAGRIGNASDAVELLVSKNIDEAREKALLLETLNENRRNIDKDITEQALNMIDNNPTLHNAKTTVLHHPEWHKGVIGIVASRIIENYYRPTIILTTDKGKVSGSARSVKGFDVYNAIKSCEDLLLQFGGHKYAAGLTMETHNIEAFMARFEAIVSDSILAEHLVPEVQIDAEVELEELTPTFYKILSQFAPFGPGNMEPIFVTRNVHDVGSSSLVGTPKAHLKYKIQKGNSPTYEGIGFNMADKFDIVKNGSFDICYKLTLNEFRGTKSLQLMVKDIVSSELHAAKTTVKNASSTSGG